MRPLVCALFCAAAGAQIRFEEVARKAGIQFELHNGATGKLHQIELMPGGVAAFDFDNDGCMDLYFTNGAAIPGLKKTGPEFLNRLYRNRCDGTFEDVTARAGVGGEGYSMAVATADFDNDGLADIFVAGVNRNILYRNLGGGRFADVTAKAGLAGIDAEQGKMWSISAGWFDYDNDGWLDLFVSNYVVWNPASEPQCGPPDGRFYCHPNAYTGLPNQLFHNNRDGTFTDVSRKSGIASQIGKGMGVAFADFDGDGFVDVFVANDSVRSFLFHNQRNGTFREIGLESGVALREDGKAIAGMGADFRDFDNDGRPDLVVSGMINDGFLLYRNTPRQFFADVAQSSGLLLATRPLTGWSLGLYDFDNDGWRDLFCAVSHFPALDRYLGKTAAQPNTVFRNVEGRFEDVSRDAGPDLQTPALYHGAAFADFDNDGRVDVVVTALNGPARLYRNVTPAAGHWLAVRLRGRRSNSQGLGAEVRVTLPDGRVLYGHATTSVGYASSSEPLVRFGLGPNAVARSIEVRWPGGGRQELKDVKANRIVEIQEEARP